MAIYEYACTRCGRFDVRLAIGTAPDSYGCPECARSARRAFSAPMLGNVSKPVGTLLGLEEQSRDEPEVVTQLPKRPDGRPASPPHPALARLPRP